MARRPASDPHTGFLARLNALETVVLAIIALVALAGLMLVGKGFYLKAVAEISAEPTRAEVAARW